MRPSTPRRPGPGTGVVRRRARRRPGTRCPVTTHVLHTTSPADTSIEITESPAAPVRRPAPARSCGPARGPLRRRSMPRAGRTPRARHPSRTSARRRRVAGRMISVLPSSRKEVMTRCVTPSAPVVAVVVTTSSSWVANVSAPVATTCASPSPSASFAQTLLRYSPSGPGPLVIQTARPAVSPTHGSSWSSPSAERSESRCSVTVTGDPAAPSYTRIAQSPGSPPSTTGVSTRPAGHPGAPH